MAEEFNDYPPLLARLQMLIGERSPRIVGVEGMMQSGKTHLAGRIGADLQAAVLRADDFSFKNREPQRAKKLPDGLPYPKLIDLAALSDALCSALQEHAVVVVEAICLRDVLSEIGHSPDLTVYVKCLSANTGQWFIPVDIDLFEQGECDLNGLHRDEIEYHSRVRPHELSALVFVRVENVPDKD